MAAGFPDGKRPLLAAACGAVAGVAAYLAMRPRSLEGPDFDGTWLSIPLPLEPVALVSWAPAGALMAMVLVRATEAIRPRDAEPEALDNLRCVVHNCIIHLEERQVTVDPRDPDELEFLASYDAERVPAPVRRRRRRPPDGRRTSGLRTLLLRRTRAAAAGPLGGIPGGFVRIDESLDDAGGARARDEGRARGRVHGAALHVRRPAPGSADAGDQRRVLRAGRRRAARGGGRRPRRQRACARRPGLPRRRRGRTARGPRGRTAASSPSPSTTSRSSPPPSSASAASWTTRRSGSSSCPRRSRCATCAWSTRRSWAARSTRTASGARCWIAGSSRPPGERARRAWAIDRRSSTGSSGPRARGPR